MRRWSTGNLTEPPDGSRKQFTSARRDNKPWTAKKAATNSARRTTTFLAQHVDNLLAVCSQSLLALRTLRQHGLPNDALHQVFQAIVINRLSYASPAWWGFTSADDRNRLEAFVRRSVKLGYRANSSVTFASICDDADNKLFFTDYRQQSAPATSAPSFWTRAALQSSRPKSQLPTSWSYVSHQWQKLYYKNALKWQYVLG